MKLIVNSDQRFSKMRAHTATHLLHAELAKIFPQTKQAGSLVDDDYLRFDFQSDRLLTQEEIVRIEKSINQLIYLADDVVVEEMSLKDATKLGAKAFFEDKYGSTVRVVMVKDWQQDVKAVEDGKIEKLKDGNLAYRQAGMEALKSERINEHFLSLELCGGTHVENTKDIGCFAIVGQEAVASGVKRITAVTGPKVSERIQEVQGILDSVVNKLGIKTATQLEDKLDKVMKESEDMKATLEGLETTMIKQLLTGSDFSSGKDLDKVFLIPAELGFKNVVFQAKGMFKKQNILIYNKEGSFVLMADKGTSAKEFAERLGIKGGGNDHMVQGRDEKILGLFK
ncbi:MAG: hypothetical protein WC875_05925 [Candidatus Absconditabacterales bacterium]